MIINPARERTTHKALVRNFFKVCLVAFGGTLILGGQAESNKAHPKKASIFDVPYTLSTSEEAPLNLAAYQKGLQETRGALLVGMFYASCQSMCPVTIEQIKRLISELPKKKQAKVKVLLVSFDPSEKKETFEAVYEKHQLSRDQWTLARASNDSDVRFLATLLGVNYRQLANKVDYDHTAVINAYDPDGAFLAKDLATAAMPTLEAALKEAIP